MNISPFGFPLGMAGAPGAPGQAPAPFPGFGALLQGGMPTAAQPGATAPLPGLANAGIGELSLLPAAAPVAQAVQMLQTVAPAPVAAATLATASAAQPALAAATPALVDTSADGAGVIEGPLIVGEGALPAQPTDPEPMGEMPTPRPTPVGAREEESVEPMETPRAPATTDTPARVPQASMLPAEPEPSDTAPADAPAGNSVRSPAQASGPSAAPTVRPASVRSPRGEAAPTLPEAPQPEALLAMPQPARAEPIAQTTSTQIASPDAPLPPTAGQTEPEATNLPASAEAVSLAAMPAPIAADAGMLIATVAANTPNPAAARPAPASARGTTTPSAPRIAAAAGTTPDPQAARAPFAEAASPGAPTLRTASADPEATLPDTAADPRAASPSASATPGAPAPHSPVSFASRVSVPAPAPAAAAPEVELPARAGALGRTLGVEIARQVGAGEETLRVRLNPAEFGRIEVTLAFASEGSLKATVSAESARAIDLLRQDLPDLTRTLDQAGVRTDAQSFRFESRTGGDGQQGQPHQQRGGDSQHRQSAHDEFEPAPAYRAIRSDGQVDLLA